MGTYVLKRLIIMCFTMVLISFVIFVVINAAPGRAGQGQLSSGEGESVRDQAGAREGYLLFKLQYGLNHPLLFNMRFGLDPEAITEAVEIVAQNLSQALPGEAEAIDVCASASDVFNRLKFPEYFDLTEQLNATDLSLEEREALEAERLDLEYIPVEIGPERPEPEDLVDAQEDIEDWGMWAVPTLIDVATTHSRLKVRWQAVEYLTLNAQDRNIDPESGAIRANIPERRLTRAASRLFPLAGALAGATAGGPGAAFTPVAASLRRVSEFEFRRILPRSDLERWTYELGATAEERAEIESLWLAWLERNAGRFELGFWDKTEVFFTETRLFTYWSRLLHGDLGVSSQYHTPVLGLILSKWKYSIYLSLLAVFFSYFLAVPLGLLAAVKRGQLFDRVSSVMLFLLYSLPSFFAATLLQDYLTRAKTNSQVYGLLTSILMLVCCVFGPVMFGVSVRDKAKRGLQSTRTANVSSKLYSRLHSAFDNRFVALVEVVGCGLIAWSVWRQLFGTWGAVLAVLVTLPLVAGALRTGQTRFAVLSTMCMVIAILPGFMFALGILNYGGYFVAGVFIVAWPLWSSIRSWRQSIREAAASGGRIRAGFPIGRWVGLGLAGAGVTAVFALLNGLFPAPVSGFATDGLRLNATTFDYFVDVMTHLVLPVSCLTYASLAYLSRYARAGLLDVINSDYIRTARAKGLSESVVILKHAVRNGMIPILTLLASALPALVGGSVIIEYIFDIPGMGNLVLDAVLQQDTNIVMGVLQISALMTLIGVLISDISYAIVDPRIKFD